jgi:hypothetical protein
MKLTLIRTLSLVLYFVITGLSLKAQSSDAVYFVPSLYPKSPNVASFTKYGDYQVNLFTGIPNISIPLYTIEAGDLKVPITLSYHPTGNKLTDVASWVGLSWSIMGGGAISRRVIGGPDDGTYGYLRGYMRQQGTLNMQVDSDMLYVDRIANGLYDGRPDIYSFDFPGHSGKFFFNATNAYKPVLVPYSPVNINYNMPAERFILTDEHGNVSTFGEASSEWTESSGGGNNAGPVSITSWMMENMISQNKRDTVSFTYGHDTLLYPGATSQMLAVTDAVQYLGGSPPGPYTPNVNQGTTTGFLTSVTELPMQQINFKNGKVVFELDSAWRSDVSYKVYGLKDIKVYAYNYATKVMEVQKTIKFYKSYFGSTTPPANLRLRLDSIQVLDAAGAIVQHYRFGYNNSINMPWYGSLAYDYWGYYNGKDASTSLIPKQTVPFNGGTTQIGGTIDHNRDPDSLHMQAYMLDTIYYPTGGHTVFTYQTNQYHNSSGTLRLAGGLRISSISSYDGISSIPIVKTYQYNQADSNFFLNYHYFAAPIQKHRYYILQQSEYIQGYGCNVTNYVSNPTIDLEPWDAVPVVYPSVTEYYGTPGNNIGGSSSLFDYEADDTQDGSMVGTPIVTTYYYNRGNLLSKLDFLRKSDGSHQPVKVVTNTYHAFPQIEYLAVGFVARKLYSNEGGDGFSNSTPLYYSENAFISPTDVDSYIYDNYFIYSTDNYLTSTTTNDYDINDSTKYTTSTDTYVYGDTTHFQVAKVYHTDSKGNTHVTVNKYPFDYLSGLTTHNGVLDTMLNRHMWAETIEKWDTLKNVTTSVNAVVGAQLNQYQLGNLAGAPVPSTISTLSVASPLTNFVPAYVNTSTGVLTGDSRYVQMISFDHYDAKNNITQYTPRNATPTAVMWDHTFELPVAQVKNAPGYSTTVTTYAYTSFEADSHGQWTYAGTPLYDPTAPTGFYTYPLGAGAITSGVLDNTRAYVLSYWAKGGPATVQYGSTNYTGALLQSANGWSYYEHQLPTATTTGALNISGSISVDELRLYPTDAQMITYNYDPSGLRSISDTKGANSYFDYDFAQRLKNVKDWQGNVVKNYGYHTYDQTFGNQVQSASIPRNNCPPNTTPGSLTYTVPANKYYSSTLASANADAIYDMDLNGQIKANANCSCTVIYISVQVTNSAGPASYPISFTGLPTYYVPTGVSNISVPQGSYATCQVGPEGSGTYKFTMGTRPAQDNVHYATFNTVSIQPGSGDLTITIANP